MGYIYLLKSDVDGHITYKIGKTSRNPKDRMNELSTGNAGNLNVECIFESNNYHKLEVMLHANFRRYNINREWFDDNVTKTSFLDACKEWDSRIESLLKMENPFI